MGILIIRDELKAKREKKRQERLDRIKFDGALIRWFTDCVIRCIVQRIWGQGERLRLAKLDE